MKALSEIKLAVIGLGYVGLPLAVEFGKQRSVVGFDINQPRIAALQAGHDSTLEVSDEELAQAAQLSYTSNLDDLKNCNVFIVTVPTPIDEFKRPDLTPLIKASETIGKVLKKATSLFTSRLCILAQQKKTVCLYLSGYRVWSLTKIFMRATAQSVLILVIKNIV